MAEGKEANPIRKAYEKPRIESVALKPEEAVLTACKTNSGVIKALLGEYCAGGLFQCQNLGS